MQFKLNKLKSMNKNQFQPVEQIIQHVRCSTCDNRETSRMSTGFTLRGFQVWCDNCEISIVHMELEGEIKVDPYPQGRFNERNLQGKERISEYNFSTADLVQRRDEENTNSGIENNLRHNHKVPIYKG